MAETTKQAKPSTPEQKAARDLGRAYFLQVMKQHKPDMTKEERQESWKQSQRQFVSLGRRVLKMMEKSGYKIVPNS